MLLVNIHWAFQLAIVAPERLQEWVVQKDTSEVLYSESEIVSSSPLHRLIKDIFIPILLIMGVYLLSDSE